MTETATELNPPPTPSTPGRGVTREEVRHVAALAALQLTAGEEERMERDLNSILGYVAELNGLDTTNVEPLSQVSEIIAAPSAGAGPQVTQRLRLDESRVSLPRSTVMAEAPATDGIFFKVPKVIER